MRGGNGVVGNWGKDSSQKNLGAEARKRPLIVSPSCSAQVSGERVASVISANSRILNS